MRKEVIEVVGLSGPTDLLMPALRAPLPARAGRGAECGVSGHVRRRRSTSTAVRLG